MSCPQQIYFFRDGISEGEFLSVGASEISEIKSDLSIALFTMMITDQIPRRD